MRNIQTITQLKDLQGETFVFAAIVAFLIFGFALLFANLTPWQGGQDKSYVKRRIWFVLCVVVGSLGFWLYNELYVMDFIKKTALQNQFFHTNMQCLGITIVGSLLISFLVMIIFRNSKFASIIFKIKGK